MPERRTATPAGVFRRPVTRTIATPSWKVRQVQKESPVSGARSGRVPVTRRPPVSRHPVKVESPKGDVEALTKDCRGCRVLVRRMNFDDWFSKQRRTSPKPQSPPRTRADVDSRLRKKENGMVMLPRSFYNEHPASKIVTTKKRSGGAKRRPSEPDPEQPDDAEFAYRLVFENVESAVEKRPFLDDEVGSFSLKDLSDSIESDGLPSDMWEIERIPPRLNARRETDGSYDTIAAELEALMGETAEPEPEPEPIVDGAAVETPKEAIPEDRERFPSIMDILNEPPANPETEIEPPKVETEPTECEAAEVPEEPKPKEPESAEMTLPKEPVVDDYEPKNVIFRRLTADKQTYDRLVAFDADMVYCVAINDAKVQLLGAPERIYSSEDLKILLQIVDNVTLNSFNVALKS